MRCIYAEEYCSAINKNGGTVCVGARMDLEMIILRERNQKEKDKYQ